MVGWVPCHSYGKKNKKITGHVIFTLAMGWDFFWMAVAGEALHGFGSGAVVVAMRAVVSKFFLDNELTFALVSKRKRKKSTKRKRQECAKASIT